MSASEKAERLKLIKEEGYERIHAAFWGAVQGQHPDNLMLRFLRARKWDVKAGSSFLSFALVSVEQSKLFSVHDVNLHAQMENRTRRR